MFATTCRFAVWFALLLPAVWPSSSAAAAEAQPAFSIRGTLPWHNFLSGPTAWNEGDYRELDQFLQEVANTRNR